MDQLDLRLSPSEIDLESGGSTSEEDGCKNPNLSGSNSKKRLHRVWSEFLGQGPPDGHAKGRGSPHSLGKVSSSHEFFVKSGEPLPKKLTEEKTHLAEKKMVREMPKKSEATRPPKPPRPPRGPSLDASDMKLVEEISELAILKRKRTQRLKALQKRGKEKGSSMSINLLAMAVTILFLFVIIFQASN